jgi:hypothetical protein
MQVVLTLTSLCRFSDLLDRRQQHANERADYGDNDQQFDESEATADLATRALHRYAPTIGYLRQLPNAKVELALQSCKKKAIGVVFARYPAIIEGRVIANRMLDLGEKIGHRF